MTTTTPTPARRSLKVEKVEKIFLLITFAFLVGAAGLLVLTVAAGHASLPEPAGRIDPAAIDTTAPFDAPGLNRTGPDSFDLVLIGQAWAWTPAEIRIPVGSEVRMLLTSRDVVHGIRIPDTNVNAMVIPGQITEVTTRFDEVGAFSIICHEYCGIGHHGMGAVIRIVEDIEEPAV